MRLTVERLRGVVLLGVGALVLALLAVLGWAHFRAHERLRDLPAHLGADIQREGSGITYSQTIAGRVVFTLHARQATQRRSGEAQLADAGLVLYGDGNGRADRIYGKNFLYDQKAGVVTAIGQVQLDLGAPAPTTTPERIAFASGGAAPSHTTTHTSGEEPVHATTSGLRYVQATGLASTDERVTFSYKGMQGASTGATYASRNGALILNRDVTLRGQQNGRPFTVEATHAVFERAKGQLVLSQALIHVANKQQAGPEIVRAVLLTLHLRPEGGIENAVGRDGVDLRNAGQMITGPSAVLTFRAGNQPQELRMQGGVSFARSATASNGALTGSGSESLSRFDAAGRLSAEQINGNVVIDSTENHGDTRHLTADQVNLALADGILQQATANGSARLRAQRPAGLEDEIGADHLLAEFTGKQPQLTRVTGRGSAMLRRSQPGLVETSHAPQVVARFAPSAADASNTTSVGGRAQIAEVLETGGVVLDRQQTRDGSTTQSHATAQQATYEARTQHAVLTGSVVLQEPQRMLQADQITIFDNSGDAEATGAVQASLLPEPGGASSKSTSADPVHAVAARALLRRADDVLTLYGGAPSSAAASATTSSSPTAQPASADARLWQGASQVEAPVLVLRQKAGTLDAYGDAPPGTLVVRTVLADSGNPAGAPSVRPAQPQLSRPRPSQPRATAGQHLPKVVRVRSGRLHFLNGPAGAAAGSFSSRRAEFSGGVEMQSRDGIVRAERAVATLRPVAAARHTSGLQMAGGVESVVAQGAVTLQQPGRTATGSELVWNADQNLFTLTGTPAAPPRVTDAINGTLTGGSIQFHAGDSSVVVTGAALGQKSGRVQTETRLQQ